MLPPKKLPKLSDVVYGSVKVCRVQVYFVKSCRARQGAPKTLLFRHRFRASKNRAAACPTMDRLETNLLDKEPIFLWPTLKIFGCFFADKIAKITENAKNCNFFLNFRQSKIIFRRCPMWYALLHHQPQTEKYILF